MFDANSSLKMVFMGKRLLVIQHIAADHLGTFANTFEDMGIDLHVVRLHEKDEVPASIDDYKGLVLLGGSMSAYDDARYDFLAKEEVLIKQAILRKVPTLGVCLGAQLIAKAAGARVFRGPRKEIGWYRVKFSKEAASHRLFKLFGEEAYLFQWHGDTFELPRSALRMAASSLYPNQAFRIGYNVFGIQFHLEANEEIVQEWSTRFENEVNEVSKPETIETETELYLPRMKELSREFASSFTRLL